MLAVEVIDNELWRASQHADAKSPECLKRFVSSTEKEGLWQECPAWLCLAMCHVFDEIGVLAAGVAGADDGDHL